MLSRTVLWSVQRMSHHKCTSYCKKKVKASPLLLATASGPLLFCNKRPTFYESVCTFWTSSRGAALRYSFRQLNMATSARPHSFQTVQAPCTAQPSLNSSEKYCRACAGGAVPFLQEQELVLNWQKLEGELVGPEVYMYKAQHWLWPGQMNAAYMTEVHI